MSTPSGSTPEFDASLTKVFEHILNRHHTLSDLPITPSSSSVSAAISSLPAHLPSKGLGTIATTEYLLSTLLPGILQAQSGPRYFGFVTGGVTEAAQIADIVGSSYDENVQVTLGTSASTAIEARMYELILDLLDIPRNSFQGRSITTGATASNVLGLGKLSLHNLWDNDRSTAYLACARDYLYSVSPHLPSGYSYAKSGPPISPTLPNPPIILLTLHAHFSILKAASLVGIGSGPNVVQTLPNVEGDELAFDISALRKRLEEEKTVGRGVIVCYGLGEVNTGGFAGDLEQVAKACEEFGAWLHVDAGKRC
jgi:glutamate/tyrosine decarboxylase-like PLP-dependent enzyme